MMIYQGIRFLIILGYLFLAGCAGRREGVMDPQKSVLTEKQKVIPILSVTTRALSQNPAYMFSEKRSSKISLADIGISIPPVHKSGELEWPTTQDQDPQKYFSTAWAKTTDLSGFSGILKRRMAQSGAKGHVLVFIHGYNNRFEDAVYRFAQIAYDSGSKSVPVLFTWPSQGRVLGYPYDRESVAYSRDGLEYLLQALVREPSVRDISILAHSMGGLLTLEALKQMNVRNRNLSPKIKNLMLASPDIDMDVARVLIDGLGKSRPRITLFASQDDVALKFSMRVWGSSRRLGSVNATTEPYSSIFRKKNIHVIDMTAVKGGDSLHHNKFAASPEVVQLIGRRIAAGQKLSNDAIGFGDHINYVVSGTTKTAGNAASIVLSVPVSLVDRDARRDFSERLETTFDPIIPKNREERDTWLE